jgi:ATP-binding cassette subfamily F protein 3
MLSIEDLSYAIEGRPLFEGASARIPTGHKVGLVGANGTGKTTLFRLIRGEVVPDGGSISLPSRARIGAVAQEVAGGPEPILDLVLAADTERAALLAEAERAEGERIAEIQMRLADIDAWSAEARASSILTGLGFGAAEQGRPASEFSGGWRMRVALAGVLFARPDLLLLDEPTNYLDLEGALWLEGYLARYPHTVLVISHDRGLLNRAVQGILHLESRKLAFWAGDYDAFARQRAERRAQLQAEARKVEARRAHLQSFVDRFRAKASKAVQAQSRLKMLERLTPISTPEEAQRIAFRFPPPEEVAPPILTADGASVGYDGRTVLRGLDLRIDQDDRIALLGRNGEGKSTLAKLIAGRLEPMGGRVQRSNRLRVGFFAQHQIEDLDPEETPLAHIRRLRPAEGPAKLRARLASFGLLADQAETAVGRLSGGQKARLSLLIATIDAPHLLILDEPTNHLDIESREALVEALTEYAGAVILVSHDMHLLGLVADRLWLVQGGRVSPYEQDLEAYRRQLLAPPPTAAQAARAAQNAAPAPTPPRADRAALVTLRADLRAAEAEVERLSTLRARIEAKLADPATWEGALAARAPDLQRRHIEVGAELERAEARWLAAQENLEAAGG